MSQENKNSASRKVFQLSGGLGCFPSLIFFIFVLGGNYHSGLSVAASFALFSLICGIGGLIGIFSAMAMRNKENRMSK